MSFTATLRLPNYDAIALGFRVLPVNQNERLNGDADDAMVVNGSSLRSAVVAEELTGVFNYEIRRVDLDRVIRIGWFKRSASQNSVVLDDPRDFPASLSEIDEVASCEEIEPDPTETPGVLNPDAIGEALAGPARMTVEGNTFENYSLADQIAADKYRRNLIEAEKPLSQRIRIGKFTPPGTT